MRLLYFAWLKQKIGHSEEEITLPDSVTNVEQLLAWLTKRGENYAAAFSDPKLVRVAVNQEYARPGDPVKEGDEVALFPPVTGG
ncbi:MAG TPA: molybdopterin converting factor subunit 1 [Kiloniellales bacterium]|nr:molybdopterin converting factor subunit 1 [Kiloniellales bacterium]